MRIISSWREDTFQLQVCDVSLNGHMSAVHEENMTVDMGTAGICEKAVIARENQTYFGKTSIFL